MLAPDDTRCLSLRGSWTLDNFASLSQALAEVPGDIGALDASGLTELDTAGASLLLTALGADRLAQLTASARGLSEERRALLTTVATAVANQRSDVQSGSYRFGDGLAKLGREAADAVQQLLHFLAFLGATLVTLCRLLPQPKRWRITALVAQMQQIGLNAAPIVILLNFLVGAVVAFLGATVLQEFGATIYTVDLVAYAFMRELGAMLTAILLAGRTASAFTAQLGSMKINEELDALQVQQLDAIELLVLPRLLAMTLMLPLLTFAAMLAGMLGGAAVAVASLDISLPMYINIIQEIPLRHLLLGMSKTPFFALVIALIGCLEGFKVGGSAQSLGHHTTSGVVQCIFMVILLDAIAALFFMEMGW